MGCTECHSCSDSCVHGIGVIAPCRLRDCKKRAAPFPDRMS